MLSETHHARLLLTIVRQDWDAAEKYGGPAGGVDPATFSRLCRESDVHGWVHCLLTEQDRWSLVGDEARTRLGEARAKVRADNLLLLARVEQALDALLGAGVVPIALKGLDTLHRFYPRFDLRTLDDVDLLILPAQLNEALEALQGAGWRLPPEPTRSHYIRSSHHLPLGGPGEIPVDIELHWNLAQELRYRIDVPGLHERARELDIEGRKVLRLDDHDLLAHLLVHHFSHYFDRRLKWLVDVAAITAQPDFRWERVAGRIRSWGAAAAAAAALQHLHKLWPEVVPREALSALPLAAWRRALTLPLRSSHPLELFRATRNRRVQLYLAAVMLEKPTLIPAWLRHRSVRDHRPGENPLDTGS